MLPKINRIRKKKEFELIFKNSKSLKTDFFTFKIRKNGLEINRFGFVVSQKVSKRAVIRNKVRRRLSDIMRAKSEKMITGLDLVIIAFSGIDKKEFPELENLIEDAVARAGLMVKK